PAGLPALEVSSIVQVDGVDRTTADRLGTLVLAGVNTHHDPARPMRVQTIHDEERHRMKIVILGDAATTADLLRLIDSVLGEGGDLLSGGPADA
ncbi:DNA-binding protein, partial [Micromonospora azadirachtae]